MREWGGLELLVSPCYRPPTLLVVKSEIEKKVSEVIHFWSFIFFSILDLLKGGLRVTTTYV